MTKDQQEIERLRNALETIREAMRSKYVGASADSAEDRMLQLRGYCRIIADSALDGAWRVKDISYVRAETERLAEQVAALAVSP